MFSSWYVFFFRKRNVLIFSDRLIAAFIAGLTQIIATGMLLGVVFEKLFPAPLFWVNVSISSVLTAVTVSGEWRECLNEIPAELSRIVKTISEDLVLCSVFILFVLTVLWLIFTGYLFPSYTWDALYYHLPIVGQIMQNGAIQETLWPSFIQQYINIFPKNINLFFLWNVIFLKSDAIVDLSQLCFSLAGTAAVYSILLKLKVKERYAIYSALLFFFSPMIILQSTSNYVDCAVSMLFIIAVNFLLYSENNRRLMFVLSGLSLGLLLGSKPTGPLFFGLVSGIVLVREAVGGFRCGAIGSRMREWLVYFILPAVFAGGYWYIRNWLYHGNPVYYMDVSVFGTQIFKGLESNWVESAPDVINGLNYLTGLVHVWMDRVGYYMYDSRLSGFGPIWFILFLPSILFSLVYAVLKRKYDLLFVIMLFIITFLLHPRNWTTRYVIFFIGLGAVSFGIMMDHFSKREKALKPVILILAAYTFLTANSPCIMPSKIAEFINLPANERTLSALKPFNIDEKVRTEYGYWTWIDNNVHKGDTLALTFADKTLDTSRPFFFGPLWNREFSSRVIYLRSKEYNDWLKEIENSQADYILTAKGSIQEAWIEKQRRAYYAVRWMGNVKEKFKIMYSDENYMIAKYIRAGK